VSTTERIYALLVTANPVPDWDALSDRAADAVPRLRVVEPWTEAVRAQERGRKRWMRAPRRRRLIPLLAAAVVVALIAAATIVLIGDDPGVDSFIDSEPSTPTTVAPATTGAATTIREQTPAMSIAGAGLPTEWRVTLSTQLTDVDEAVRLDSSIRFDDEQFPAEGSASHVVALVQDTVVECLGTTYDAEFLWLWAATTRGAGELDFGDSGSVTIEFDAVWVTSSQTAGLGTGPGQPRVCAEWTGTYTGASGDLADASGTFTTAFPGASQAQAPTWTFDS